MNNTANRGADERSRGTDGGRDVDELFDVLSEERRRTVLKVLAESERALERRRLAREAVAVSADCPVEEAPADRVQTTDLRLHHVHLPKLVDAGLVEYDAEGGTVAPAEDYGAAVEGSEAVAEVLLVGIA